MLHSRYLILLVVNLMRRLTFLLTLVACLLFTVPSYGQSGPRLAELQIDFWPEYDRAAMLVIYRGTLTADTALPAPLTFRYPAQFGAPLAVAYGDAQGRLISLEYTSLTQGGDLLVTFSTPAASFQIEYYDTTLDLSTSPRQYAYASLAPYPIQSLLFKVQHPVGAANLTTVPAFTNATTDAAGLIYSEVTRANLATGDAINLTLQYAKTSSTLTVDSFPASAPTAPPPASTPSTTDPVTLGIIVIGLAGAGLLIWGGFSYWRGNREESAPPRTKRRPRATPTVEVAPATETETATVFCHKCGQRAQPGDGFCRQCGTTLRRED